MGKYELKESAIAKVVIINESEAKVTTLAGKEVTSEVKSQALLKAIEKKEEIMFLSDGIWKREGYLTAKEKEEVFAFAKGVKASKPKVEVKEAPEVMAFKEFIHGSVEMRPELLKMPDLKWKYLVRSVLRGKNIMMTGPAGSGKTFAVQQLTKALNSEAKTVKKTVSRAELEAMKQNMKIEIATYKKVS